MRIRYALRLVSVLVCVLIAATAIAQVSTNYNLSWWSLNDGGEQRQSANFRLYDSLAPMGDNLGSANFGVQSGLVPGNATPTPSFTPIPDATNTPTPVPPTVAPTATPTFTPLPTATPTPTSPPTNTPTHTPTPLPTNTPTHTPTNTPIPTNTPTAPPTSTFTPTPDPLADSFEPDDLCAQAKPITTDGTPQERTFHREGDVDWVRFEAQANKTYTVRVENVGSDADAMIALYDNCGTTPNEGANNTFGTTVRLDWDSTRNGPYYVEVRQFDPDKFGANANYRITVTVDTTPPSAPSALRCIAVDSTTIGVQWQRSPERDVRQYRISYGSGLSNVFGGDTTYYEVGDLTPGLTYNFEVFAIDFSQNVSPSSGQVACTAQAPADSTIPSVALQQPSATDVYTTTANRITFSGLATDTGNNLSRVQVTNVSIGQEKWDYTLQGGSSPFRVEDIVLQKGNNNVRIRVFDEAGNVGERTVTVQRLGESPGAVIIVAGHNETFGLQTNIYNSTNRAYRIFLSAGYDPADIFYISPVPQDATGDGTPDTSAAASPAAVQQAITVWAKERVGPDRPLFVYLMDHGFHNKFCVSGCDEANSFTPSELDSWLRNLEDETGLTELTVVIEACVSGSFIAREDQSGNPDVLNSLSKVGRVIITSTDHLTNAYASAQGAYFSDAFFSCIADSNDLKTCFDEARLAVLATGIDQRPLLDDNGDGLFNAQDGTIASQRYVTRFFSSVRPTITSVDLERDGSNGTLTAVVEPGAEAVDLVWAAVFRPNFEEPTGVTLNLGVPLLRLEAVPGQPNNFSVDYPNGFVEEGDYRVIFYAQDRFGLNATPRQPGQVVADQQIFLPLVTK